MQWYKVLANMFNDEKFVIIDTMPKRDSYIAIWQKLLCLCASQDRGGYIRISNEMPIDRDELEYLGAIIKRDKEDVEEAVKLFEKFGMVGFDDGGLFITNWEKHQSTDNSHNEYMRKYMAERRKKEKEKEVKKEEIKKEKPKKEKPTAHKRGEYGNVLLTDEQYGKLKEEYEEADEIIKFFDEQCEAKGYKYKNYYQAIKNWGVKAYQDKKPKEFKPYEIKVDELSPEEIRKRLYPKKKVYTLDEMNVQEADIEAIKKELFKKG